MRFLRTVVACALLLGLATLAACSGSGSSSSASATQGGSSSGGNESNAASQSAAASASSGGGGTVDLNSLVDALKPPNSTQTTRTDANGGVFIGWESTDSVDSLKSFYEDAIPKTGMKIFSTSNTSGTYVWVFAVADGSTHGGSETITPSTSGGNGTTVVLTAKS